MAKKASNGNEEYHTLQVELLAVSCTMSMEVRNFLLLPSTSWVEFPSSKFNNKIHNSNFACKYMVTRSAYLWQMHQSFKLLKTSRKETLRIASYCGANVQDFHRVSSVINTELIQGDLTPSPTPPFFPSFFSFCFFSSLEGKVQKSDPFTKSNHRSYQFTAVGTTGLYQMERKLLSVYVY